MDLVTLAMHSDHWNNGHWWGILVPFVWFFLIAGTVYFFKRRAWANGRGGCGGGGRSTAESVLAERFAKGEISADEYQERKQVLGGTKR